MSMHSLPSGRCFASLLLAGLLYWPLVGWAGAPTDALRGTIQQVLAVLQSPELDDLARREQIRTLIGARFDYRIMSQSTLARNWKEASSEQQNRFVDLYARMMQDTYLVLVEEYRDQTVEYASEKIKKEKYAQVDTFILDAGKKIPVNYKLRRKESDWLVYDVVIEGVSMVSNYRNSYQQIVKADGIDGLLAKISDRLDSATE